ncbi:MAG: carbohydrate kinase, partial [Armatimonadota bacterium]
MVEMTEARFISILQRFTDVSVAVVGDYFLDKYLIIDPDLSEPSLETGLEAFQVVDRRISPGAAGTVVSNLHALGIGAIHAIGLTGRDGEGFELRQGLSAWDVDMQHLLEHPGGFTPTYTKPMIKQPDEGEKESNRIDIVNREPLPADIQRAIIEAAEECLAAVDAIIIAEQIEDAVL